MRQREFRWYAAPGFTIIQVRDAFCEFGLDAIKQYDEQISVRKRAGWKQIRISINLIRERPDSRSPPRKPAKS